MKAKDFKKLIADIPDDDNLIFTYSMFYFTGAREVFNGKGIKKYFKSEGMDNDDIPHGKHDWMVEFDN